MKVLLETVKPGEGFVFLGCPHVVLDCPAKGSVRVENLSTGKVLFLPRNQVVLF